MTKQFTELSTEELLDTCYLYKHSTQCGLSAKAAEVINAFKFGMPLYWLNVIENRSVSNWVETKYGIQHETPQLLKIESGKVTKVWNHRQIKAEDIS